MLAVDSVSSGLTVAGRSEVMAFNYSMAIQSVNIIWSSDRVAKSHWLEADLRTDRWRSWLSDFPDVLASGRKRYHRRHDRGACFAPS